MATKLVIDLTVEQMRVLHATALRQCEAATGDERVRWGAIARESGRALAFATERKANGTNGANGASGANGSR